MNIYLDNIKAKWDLPTVYLNFLSSLPPQGKVIQEDGFSEIRTIYGAENLIEKQNGYSFNPVSNKQNTEWPSDFVVIADREANPYVVDLSKSNGNEAPILFAHHGIGKWEFEEVYDSISSFISDENF